MGMDLEKVLFLIEDLISGIKKPRTVAGS